MSSPTFTTPRLRRLGRSTTGLLVRAAHPRHAAIAAIVMGLAAGIGGRPVRETVLVGLTMLVGQAVLGWQNDYIDAEADVRHHRVKPITDGLELSTLAFAIVCGVLVLVPLAVSNGFVAAAYFVVAMVIAALGNLRLPLVRQGPLSWLTWALSFGMLPAFLSYGGWGGRSLGDAPSVTLTVLAALLGVGVHLFTALWGLVADDNDEWSYLPLALARRVGATTLLVGSIVFVGGISLAIAIVARNQGLGA